MPVLTKAKHILCRAVRQHASRVYSGNDAVDAIILKSNANQDVPNLQYTLMAGYNATVTDGAVVRTASNDRFVMTQIDRPDIENGAVYTRGYLRQVNASGAFCEFVEQASASKDVWGGGSGVEGTDYGWVARANGVHVSFDNTGGLRGKFESIGQVERGAYTVFAPWSVNASFTPVADCRFVLTDGTKMRVEDVDPYTHRLQAYRCRMSLDER